VSEVVTGAQVNRCLATPQAQVTCAERGYLKRTHLSKYFEYVLVYGLDLLCYADSSLYLQELYLQKIFLNLKAHWGQHFPKSLEMCLYGGRKWLVGLFLSTE
jgi:hypothetical protein